MRARRATSIALLTSILALAAESEQLRLHEARFLLDPSPTPPAALATAPYITLPDRWRESRPGQGGSVWYRLVLPRALPGEALAVYLPSINMNAAAWLNGAWIGECGRFTEPVAHCFNRPLLLPFPARLLDDQANVIDIRLHAYANNYGELGEVWVGDMASLCTRYEGRLFWRADLARWCTALAGLGDCAAANLSFDQAVALLGEAPHLAECRWVLRAIEELAVCDERVLDERLFSTL